MIEVQNVSKKYGMTYAAHNISFSVKKGQILGLLGQNGAGKTTTLSIMTGCLAPTEGSVRMGGYDIMDSPLEAKRYLGYMPEHPPLYDEMTVSSYLRFVCDLKEVLPRIAPEHVKSVMQTTHLQDMAGRKLGNLSKGYRQRVGLAQALCASPDVLVLDEPTAGLDPQQATEFRQLLQSLRGQKTIVLSSHLLNEVQALCDQVVILHHGSVLLQGDTSQLMHGDANTLRMRAVIAAASETLLPALRSLHALTRVTALAAPGEGLCEVMLEAPRDSEPQRALFELLCGMNAPIMSLVPMEDSLEEIFLRATQPGVSTHAMGD